MIDLGTEKFHTDLDELAGNNSKVTHSKVNDFHCDINLFSICRKIKRNLEPNN